jgi:hypothetical protein
MRVLLAALLFACGCAQAQTATCHLDYGGEIRRVAARPTDKPYGVPTAQIGSFFLFRLVFEKDTAIKTYVYADRDNAAPVPLHQGSFPWPPRNGGAYGFTGLHFVYEPLRDGELKYWCELS